MCITSHSIPMVYRRGLIGRETDSGVSEGKQSKFGQKRKFKMSLPISALSVI